MAKQTDITRLIDSQRLADNLWHMVNVASPTGNECRMALAYADMLRAAGLEVEVDDTIKDSPNVIARMKGQRSGRVLQLAGHLDHIDVPHAAPQREQTRISGRGSADMKNGLAGILEMIHVLNALDRDFAGEILVTAYGLHEAPVGDSRGLNNLIERGIKGDAAIVFEGPDDYAAVMANGMAIWNLRLKHNNPACHEQCTEIDKFELFRAATKTVERLERLNETGGENKFPLLKRASCFLGQFHYGDFYNRLPDVCELQGTRRWQPNMDFGRVKDEFAAVLAECHFSDNITLEHDWIFVGDSYAIDPDAAILKSLRRSYEKVYGREMLITGHSSVTDVCRLVRQGQIPTVLCGFGTDRGHADFEYVTYEQLERSAKVALLTVMDFLSE